MTKLALPLVALAASALLGCVSACQELADRICHCQPAGSLRDTCVSSVRNQLGNATQRPTGADQPRCETLLSTCPDPDVKASQCQRILTPEGKRECGLAYGPADGGS